MPQKSMTKQYLKPGKKREDLARHTTVSRGSNGAGRVAVRATVPLKLQGVIKSGLLAKMKVLLGH